MKDFSQLRKNLKKDFSGLKKVRVGLLGDSASQLLCQAIRGAGFDDGLDIEIFEADYNQIDRQIQDAGSELYEFDPEVVVIHQSTQKLLARYNTSKASERQNLAQEEIERLVDNLAALNRQKARKIIYFNFPEIDDGVYGSFANTVSSSFVFQTRKLNMELMVLAEVQKDLFICDLSLIQNRLGRGLITQSSLYVTSDMVFSLDAIPVISQKCVRTISAMTGKVKKCVVLDLDNTIWGGVIGDDGMANIQIGDLGIGKAFTEIQHWLKKLKERGIVLAVCSKNTEAIAREPFEDHPDMVLRLEDIAVFKANWNNKVDNIMEIQETLNLGFDSMVFLDDNPFERNMVRENLPEVSVPELPEDPADYLDYLSGLDLFETVTSSSEDVNRTKMYQQESKRIAQRKEFFDETQFLQSLEMVSEVLEFNLFNAPRIAQLSQRSNQFNLRTVRYSEADVLAIIESDTKHGLTFTLEDKFGDHGLIAIVVLEERLSLEIFIETWLMSCRVLKRGMEEFVLNEVCAFALEKGIDVVRGEYLPTEKNIIVKDLYSQFGFQAEQDSWILHPSDIESRNSFIHRK